MEETVIYDADTKNEALSLTEQAKTLKIKNTDDFELAGEIALSLKRIALKIDARWKPLVRSAKESLEGIKHQWEEESEPVTVALSEILEARQTWKNEQAAIERERQVALEREAQLKAEKEREKLLKKAADVENSNPEKAEALREKAELVTEQPVFVEKTVDKTTKTKSGGTITWIDDIEVTVTEPRLVCKAVAEGLIPIDCVEFKHLKAVAKVKRWKGKIYGMVIRKTQRESQRL